MSSSVADELEAVVAEAHRLGKRVAAHAHGRLGITQAVAAQVDTIEHCSFAGPDRKYGSDFDPAVVDEIAAAGIYVCPTMNAHALALRELFGDALEKVIMGLYSGGVQIIAGTDAGIDNCPHDAYISVLSYLELVVARGVEHRPAPYRDRRPAGPLPSGLLPNGPIPSEPSSGLLPSEPSSGPLGREPFPSGPSPGAEPAVAGPAAAASALVTPAGPSSR
jgi:hypothetical protein